MIRFYVESTIQNPLTGEADIQQGFMDIELHQLEKYLTDSRSSGCSETRVVRSVQIIEKE